MISSGSSLSPLLFVNLLTFLSALGTDQYLVKLDLLAAICQTLVLGGMYISTTAVNWI